MRLLALVTASLMAALPAVAHDNDDDRLRFRVGRPDYTRIRDPEPVVVVSPPPDADVPYRPYAWGHMTSTVASNYKVRVKNCGNAACSVWQTAGVAVALPLGLVLDVPFWAGRAISWPFRRRAR